MGKYDEAEQELVRPQKWSAHEFFTEQLCRKFMLLPYEQKQLIREAAKDKIVWKGEDTHKKMPQLGGMTHFEHLISEYKRMREGNAEEYRKEALARLYGIKARGMGGAE